MTLVNELWQIYTTDIKYYVLLKNELDPYVLK